MDLSFEVVVQLRKDVHLIEVPTSTVSHYSWDDEIAETLEKHGRSDLFFGEISEASKNLFPEASLT